MAVTCLVAGFAAGWLGKPLSESTAPINTVAPVEHRAAAGIPATAAPTPPVGPPVASPALAPIVPNPVLARLDTILWLKQNGVLQSLAAFENDRLHPAFARIFGLSPAKSDQLNAAVKSARQRLDEIALKAAVPETNSDRGPVVINIPGSPVEGGAVYNDLLNTFKDVLGPELSPQFNLLAGESFERAFDRFGLNSVKYEISVQPIVSSKIGPTYLIKRYYSDADGHSRGSSTSTMSADSAIRSFPVIARFLPPVAGTPPGR